MRENHHNESGRPTLMCCTPGITAVNLTKDPLGTEGEMTVGPDSINPFRSEEERRIVEEIARRQRERQDDQLFKTMNAAAEDSGGVDHPMHTNRTIEEPAFGWDTVEDDVFDLPAIEEDDLFGVSVINPFNNQGPRF